MKKFLLALLATAACSDPGTTIRTITEHAPEIDAGAAIGYTFSDPEVSQETKDLLIATANDFVNDVPALVIEKALIYTVPYGSEPSTATEDNPRCVAPWNANICTIPFSKTLKIKVANTCTGCAQFIKDTYLGAAQAFSVMAAANGFNVSFVTSGQNVTLQDGDAGGVNLAKTTSTSRDSDDIAISGQGIGGGPGKFKRYITSVVVIDFAQIAANVPGWSKLTQAQQTRFMHNAVKHELGHVMGLGHNPTPSQLMTSGTVTLPSTSVEQLFTAQENAMTLAYNPNG